MSHLEKKVIVGKVTIPTDWISSMVVVTTPNIVEKVTIPTDWISSMVVVTTPNRIQICLDP